MEPVVTQHLDGTWTVVSQEGNVQRTNRFTADWVFTGATEVEATPGRVATMNYDANYALIDATIVLTEGSTITTRTYNGNWGLTNETITTIDPPVISINDVSVAEGDMAVFSITLDKTHTETVTVQYQTFLGSAAAGDLTTETGTITFAPGETSKIIDIQTTENATVNNGSPPQFNVQLSNPTNATLSAVPSGSGTIIDDDTAGPLPTISIANALDVIEGGTLTFTVTLSIVSATDVTVNYVTVDGSATAGEDYIFGTGTITILAGETSRSVSVSSLDDAIYENRPQAQGSETISVTLSDPVGATLLRDGAVGRIVENDPAPNLPTLSIADTSITEGGLMTFTVTLSAASASPVSVEFWSTINTPDYTSNAGFLHFAAGETTKTITIQTKEDALVEGNETVTMTLQNASGATISDATATGTIIDNDVAGLPSLSVNDVTVNESGNAVFQITLSQPSPQNVTFTYSTADGTAQRGVDYLGKTGPVTIFAGSTTATVVVNLFNDSNQESAENFTLNISNAAGASISKSAGVATITDNDVGNQLPPGEKFFIASATGQIRDDVMNGVGPDSVDALTHVLTTFDRDFPGDNYREETRGALEFDLSSLTDTITSATLRVQTEFVWDAPEQLRVYVYSGDGTITTADWNAGTQAGVVNFTTSGNAHNWYDITLDAATVQAAKAAGGIVGIVLRADGIEGAAGANYDGGASIYRDGASLHVNTAPPANLPVITIIAGSDQIEGQGVLNFGFIRTGDVSQALTITFALSGTAQAGTDYTNVSTVTFEAGSAEAVVSVVNLNDTVVDGTKTLTATLVAGSNYSVAGSSPATVIIGDDESTALYPTITVASAMATEGGILEFVLTLSEASATPVSVRWGTSTVNQSDFEAANGEVNFAPGETTKTIQIVTREDTLAEGTEQMYVSFGGQVGARSVVSLVTGTIIDNDSTVPLASISESSVVEGGMMLFTVTLSEVATGPVSITYETVSGTEVAGDFTATSGTLSFAAGETTKTISVQTTQDTIDEPNEIFGVRLLTATGATLLDANGTGTIIDDDPTPPVVPTASISDASITEGGLMTFTVTLSQATTGPVSMTYGSTPGTATVADFIAANGTLNFAAGETSKTITVQTTQDATVEPSETFNMVLSAPSGATLADATGVGTIVNDDVATPVGVSIVQSGGTTSVTEGGTGDTFTVVLSAAPTSSVTVTVTGDGDVARSPSSLVFTTTNWNVPKTVRLTAINDTIVEGAENHNVTFSVNSTDARYNALAVSPLAVAVVDNDNLPSGTAGNDTIQGTANNDTINGLGGADRLYGNGGDDILNGGNGNDWLFGGTGSDNLTGGAGTDRFIFDTAPVAGLIDKITDYNRATEALFLDNAVFNVGRASASLNNPLVLQSNFFRNGAAVDPDDRILYNQSTGTVSYDADGNGAGVAIQIVQMSPGQALAASDFYVI